MIVRGAPGPVRVLVLDGEARAALATTRALAARGDEVHVASAGGRSLAGASRWARSEHAVGDASSEPEAWAEKVRTLGRSLEAEVWLPITEVSLGSAYQTGLDGEEQMACPNRGTYEAIVDKHALLERAARLGVHVPRSRLIESPEELDGLPAGFRYPAILKPRRSRFWQDGRWHSADVWIVHDAQDLARRRADPDLRAGCLVQEYIPGHGEAVFLLTERGEPRVRFAHQRLREKPPTGGQSVLRASIAPDPELLDWSERLLADLAWSGPAMVEFRRARDGRAALMEINPRLWGSLQLAIDAGVDFPSLFVDLFLGRAVPVVEARLGVRTRWLLGDVEHLLSCLRHSHLRRELDLSVWRLAAGFLASFVDGTRTEIFRPSDLRPFLRELAGWRRD